jgi:hypothetical protein
MSKRRKGFASETRVKRGVRKVHIEKELSEKLGRNDLLPLRVEQKIQELLYANQAIRRFAPKPLLLENNRTSGFCVH